MNKSGYMVAVGLLMVIYGTLLAIGFGGVGILWENVDGLMQHYEADTFSGLDTYWHVYRILLASILIGVALTGWGWSFRVILKIVRQHHAAMRGEG